MQKYFELCIFSVLINILFIIYTVIFGFVCQINPKDRNIWRHFKFWFSWSLLFFKTDRNYLNYGMLLLSIVLLAPMESYRIGEGLLLSFLSSSRIMTLSLVLLIYVISEKKVIRKSERRNIVFKDMVYEEVKPLKKRPRKPKFEVPPNVPVFRVNLTQKYENDSVNNE